LAFRDPASAMVISSFTNTKQPVPDDAKVTHYTNNNFSLDQVNAFIAGGWEHTGSLIQVTNTNLQRVQHDIVDPLR
jgi:hypothetical protein